MRTRDPMTQSFAQMPAGSELAPLVTLTALGLSALGAAMLGLASPAMARVAPTALTSDGSVTATVTDANLINPWGAAYSPTGPFWVSDNGTGVTTLYDGSGHVIPLVVSIPPGAGQAAPSAPTGQVYYAGTGFVVKKGAASGPSLFIFATENGTISGWSPGVDSTHAINAVDRSAAGALYKGLALVPRKDGSQELMAANFASGKVEIFDQSFKLTGSFRDNDPAQTPPLPAGYAPFNVAYLGGHIYVAYALADATHHDEVAGPGLGFVDEVDENGALVRRIASGGTLNAPWGMALGPAGWGRYAGQLLVGNFGDGHINGFRLRDQRPIGTLRTRQSVLTIDGLWAILPGNGGSAGPVNTLYFTAGPAEESHGILGKLGWIP